MKFTTGFVETENSRLYDEFYSKYKTDAERVLHKQEMTHIQETIRGLYVLEMWERNGRSGSPLAMLKHYSVMDSVISHFAEAYIPKNVSKLDNSAARPEKRKTKWSAFDKWAKEHQSEQYTTDQLVEISGFSYPTTLKYVSESPLFVKVKKGLWQVADPNAGDEEQD